METYVPITVYSEMTPNPNTLKFVANKMIVNEGVFVEYNNISDTKNKSKLAEELFKFPFINNIFITRNFVAVTKNESIEWNDVTYELRQYISDFLREGSKAVNEENISSNQEIVEESNNNKDNYSDFSPKITSNIDQQIIDLLEEYVRPAVENDGGAIHFKSYKEGIVTVIMRGACSGCPSSTATLKGGIETLLKSHIPEVKEVQTEDA